MDNAINVFKKVGNTVIFQNKFLKFSTICLSKILYSLLNIPVNKIIRKNRIIFITGIGRSGTSFLANLLHQQNNILSFHETSGDNQSLIDAYCSMSEAYDYIAGYRKLIIAKRLLLSSGQLYCESNSYLRYHVEILKEVFNAEIYHIVRDGRLVVRSMMNRNTFTENDKHHTGKISPHKHDPFVNSWNHMDRFEKACWYWTHGNTYLLNKNLPIINFDKSITSYQYFCKQILEPLNIYISLATWEKEINKPKNVSRKFIFPHYDNWSGHQKEKFRNICGPVMESLGYDL
ncbi:MAG: hypothetical protein KJ737_22575 [Proteobacteria bacterium]|nr:hypothetical protein [Pseudomonadota bacterium]